LFHSLLHRTSYCIFPTSIKPSASFSANSSARKGLALALAEDRNRDLLHMDYILVALAKLVRHLGEFWSMSKGARLQALVNLGVVRVRLALRQASLHPHLGS